MLDLSESLFPFLLGDRLSVAERGVLRIVRNVTSFCFGCYACSILGHLHFLVMFGLVVVTEPFLHILVMLH